MRLTHLVKKKTCEKNDMECVIISLEEELKKDALKEPYKSLHTSKNELNQCFSATRK